MATRFGYKRVAETKDILLDWNFESDVSYIILLLEPKE